MARGAGEFGARAMEVKRSRGVVLSLLFSLALAAGPTGFRSALAADEPGGRRRDEILKAISRYAPWEPPERWLHELGGPTARNQVLRERLLASVSWIEFLAFANALDWAEPEGAATQAFLRARLPAVKAGKIRQNLIFLIALTDPRAAATLADLLGGGDGRMTEEDRIDCRLALAASGDPAAVTWFLEAFPAT